MENVKFCSHKLIITYCTNLPIHFQSLIESPESGPEISLAFANRSAVLYHLRKYKEAVDDIALAFRYRSDNAILDTTRCLINRESLYIPYWLQ